MDSDVFVKKIAKGALIILLGTLISKFFSYLYRIIIARIGVEQYGLLSLALSIIGIITFFSIIGMDLGLLRYIGYYLGKKNINGIRKVIGSSLKLTILLSFLFAILVFLLSDWISLNIFHNIKLSILLKILAVVIPLDNIRKVFLSSLRAFKRVDYEVYSKNIAENVTKTVLTLVLVILGYGLFGAVFAYIVAMIFSLFVSFYLLQKKVFPFFNKYLKNVRILHKDLVLYSWPLMFSGIFTFLLGWTDTFMLGFFKTVKVVGIYNAALPTAQLMYVVPYSLMALFLPVLSELYAKKDKIMLKKLYKITTKWIFLIEVLFFGIFLIFAKQILSFIFGNIYAGGSLVLVILSFGYLVNFVSRSSENMLMIYKKTKLLFFNFLIGAIVNIILNYLLIPPYGMVGAAIATALSYILIALLIFIQSYFVTKINPFKLDYLSISASIIIVIIVFLFLNSIFVGYNFITLILLLIGFFILYLILLLFTRSFERDDVVVVESIQNKLNLKLEFFTKFIKRFLR